MFGTLSPTLLTAPYDVHKLFSAAVYSAMLHSHLRSEAGEMKLVLTRVSYRGEGGPGISPPATISPPPPPPRNLEIEYGYYCFVTDIKQQSCLRLRQKQSERI